MIANLRPDVSVVIATMLDNAGKVWERKARKYKEVPWYRFISKARAWRSMRQAGRQFVAYINLYGDYLSAEYEVLSKRKEA